MPRPDRRQLVDAVGRHLRSTGRRLKCWKPSLSESPEKSRPASSASPFGTPLHMLPPSEKVDGVPRFLVEICEALRPHLHTEGLFRKSGSMARIKALKAQLEINESCLDAAAPCDLAAVLKRFLWELPQPLIPAELQEPLCCAQQHPAESERGPLTLLLTCLLPCRCARTLRFFCTFLQDVAARCHENKMNEVNLAMIFAPSLFPSCEPSSMPGAQQQLQLQVGAVQVLINHAPHIGKVPQLLLDDLSMPAHELDRGCQSLAGLGVARDELAEQNQRLCWRSIGDSTSSSTLVPFSAKRKALELLAQEGELGTKKWRLAVGLTSSDLSMDEAGYPFDQPLDDAPVSPSKVVGDTPLELPSVSVSVPPIASLCQRTSSCKTHHQRKLSGRSAHSSPASCEQQNVEYKSLHLFTCGRKKLQLPPDHAALDIRALKPHSWHLVKRMVAEGLEGHCFPPVWTPETQPECMDPDDGASSDEDTLPEDGQSKLDPVLFVGPTCVKLCAKEPDLDAWCGSCRRGLLRQQRALRRSLSWPDGLTGAEGNVDDPQGTAGSRSSLSHPGGGEAEPLDPSLGSQPNLQPLCTPMVCVTLNLGHLGSGEGSLELEEEQPTPSSLAQCHSHPNGACAPKHHVKTLMLAFPQTPTQPTGVSAPKQTARAQHFRRSLSHESALPSGAQAQTSGQSNPNLQPPKSPLSSLRAYGRQIFISRKYLTLSFAGLRGQREPGNAKTLPNS